jgi:membrane protein CcdC involved in cytochrome C biogenesis
MGMTDPPDYMKARDIDPAAQRHNRSVFVQRLRANPAKAIVLAAFFIALGVYLLLVPHGSGTRVTLLAAIAFGVAGWLVAATFRRN